VIPIASRVAARHIQAVFVSNKLWREQKAKLKKVLATPLQDTRPNGLNRELVDRLLPVYKETVQALIALGLPIEIEKSLTWRLENISTMIEKLVDSGRTFEQQYESAYKSGQTKTAEEVLAEAIAFEVGDLYSNAVKTVNDGLKATWSVDIRLINNLANRLIKKATPEEQDALVKTEHDYSSRLLDLKYGFFNRVGLKKAVKNIVYRNKNSYNFAGWIDGLQKMLEANYSAPVAQLEYRQFDLFGMKVVVDDSTVDSGQVKAYIGYLKQAYEAMRSKGFAKAWYGNVFIQCEECGGPNPNSANGTGGDYTVHEDTIRVYVRPSKFVVELMVHELGHRYWFKQMTETQRARFESLVKVRKPTNVTPIPEKKLEGTKAAIQNTVTFFNGLIDQFEHDGDIAKYAPLFKEAVLRKNPIYTELADLTDRWRNPKLKEGIFEYTGNQDAAEFQFRLHCLNIPKYVAEFVDYGALQSAGIKEWANDAHVLVRRMRDAALAYVDLADKLANSGDFDPNDTRPVVPVSTYGASNIDEAWAEAFMHYVCELDMTQDQIESFKSVLKTASGFTVGDRALHLK
jgi:hypothetical protein